jgi:hypothetical protein
MQHTLYPPHTIWEITAVVKRIDVPNATQNAPLFTAQTARVPRLLTLFGHAHGFPPYLPLVHNDGKPTLHLSRSESTYHCNVRPLIEHRHICAEAQHELFITRLPETLWNILRLSLASGRLSNSIWRAWPDQIWYLRYTCCLYRKQRRILRGVRNVYCFDNSCTTPDP